MTWQKNTYKEERIARCGVTVDLPLFESAREEVKKETSPSIPLLIKEREVVMPDWIWSGNGIKAAVYNQMKEKFAEDSLEYLNAIIMLGGKATDHEVKEYFNDVEQWPLHIVSARRNYFCGGENPVITSYPGKTVIGPKGKPNTVWYVNFKNLYEIIQK